MNKIAKDISVGVIIALIATAIGVILGYFYTTETNKLKIDDLTQTINELKLNTDKIDSELKTKLDQINRGLLVSRIAISKAHPDINFSILSDLVKTKNFNHQDITDILHKTKQLAKDEVYLQVAIKMSEKGFFNDALKTTQNIENILKRLNTLVKIAIAEVKASSTNITTIKKIATQNKLAQIIKTIQTIKNTADYKNILIKEAEDINPLITHTNELAKLYNSQKSYIEAKLIYQTILNIISEVYSYYPHKFEEQKIIFAPLKIRKEDIPPTESTFIQIPQSQLP